MKAHLSCKSCLIAFFSMIVLVWAAPVANSATTSTTYQVSAGADDGYAWSATGQDIGSGHLMVGNDRTYTAPYYMSAMRFTNIDAPRNAQIVDAHLKISSISEGLRGQIYGLIRAEATDDAPDFTARYIGTISKTTAAADWDHKGNWAANTYYTSPDLSSVIQEVIGRTGWNSHNSIVICYSTRTDSGKGRMFGSFEAGAAFAAVLEITYETYRISGYIKTFDNASFEGVAVSAGAGIESTTTDAGGYYELFIPPDWTGTLTATKDDIVFKPAQYTYTDLSEDLYEQNFIEYKPKISGFIHDKYGYGFEQANISADNGGASGLTDANGFYEITVPFNWSGTVTADKSGWRITPYGISYNNLITDRNDQNYSAYQPTISGHVKDEEGILLPAVTIDVQGIATLFTDANGYYQIDVPYKWTGRITPGMTGWGFVPSYRHYPLLTIDRTNQDFTSFQPDISGYVLKADGSGMEGAAVTANNGGGSFVTNSSGYYEITVPYNWSGMVSVNKVGYVFIPPDRTYSNVTGNLSNQNYTEFQPVISGYVKDGGGTGVEGVLVSADNSGGSDTTDPNGYYEVAVPYDWSGTLTPAKTGWGFNPASQTYSNVISDRTAGDYIAFQPKISGHVKDSNGIGVEGVLVSADNGGGSDTTNSSGYYEVIVPYDFSGSVTAYRPGWEITPVNRDYSNIVSDQAGQDYSAVYVGIIVKEDGTGDFNNIQAAIDFAVDRDIVFVHAGIYTGTGNRDIDFKGKAITVRGATGDANDYVIDCQGTETQTHRGFNFVGGEDANSVLEGFTITNGYAPEENISGFMRSVGGAIYCNSSGPTINNCIIIYNAVAHYGGGIYNHNSSPTISNCAVSNNSAANIGGGICNRDNSSPIISNCTISNNSGALYGGGIYNYSSSNSTISNCTISNNSAVTWGGGIYNYDCSTRISNCIINENSGHYGGGIENYNCSNLTITDCAFSNNSAAYSGGGIRNFNSDSNISNCVLSNNSAASWGGGICNMGSYPIIINCAILNNSATYSGGGIFNYSSIPTITKCAISNNTANRGGGICNATSSISNIKNCTINNNSATSSGGGVYAPSNTITIDNCIIWGNQPSQIVASATVRYSDVQGGYTGVGNINEDPCFVGDYHLSAYSQCIDAGDPDYISGPNETDIDGDPRVVGRLDMGADEFFPHDSGALFITTQYYEFQALGIDSNTPPQSLSINNYGVLELN
ncbi:MAG: right-handed parallel beta-helix repeat-containing protein, partial [Planctomycetota bacterium]